MVVDTYSFEEPNFVAIRKEKALFRLFGLSLSHSKAPLLHNFLFEKLGLTWRYEIFETDNVEEIKEKLQVDDFVGSAVTMPNKITMTQHVDIVDDGARAVGAINTIYTRKDAASGKKLFVGTNTDTFGIRDSFLYNAPETVKRSQEANKPGLVYGGGGACRSAVYALHAFLKCPQIYIINRFASEVEALKESMIQGGFKGEIIHVSSPQQAELLQTPNLIISTVPDFAPVSEEEKLAKATLEVFINGENKGAVLEMCYHPSPITRLYKEFEANNWQVIGGIEAMIYQGFGQQVLWTGYSLEEMPTKAAIDYIYEETGLKK